MKTKSTATPTKAIALSQLVQSEANVRRTGRAEGVPALAASIAAHGLLQNLTVRPLGDKFEVIAGQRRLLALQSLADAGTIPADYPVSCYVMTEGADATEISLAENEMRVAMHPADQFKAFETLADTGMSNEDIAARFGVPAASVTKLLRLAAVAPDLIDRYRSGDFGLEVIMALTLTGDHELQRKAIEEEGRYIHAGSIRRYLTQGMGATGSKLGKFVGLEAYEAAGGTVTRDLFSEDEKAYIHDPELMLKLAQAKLDDVAEETRAEGWDWVEATLDSFPWESFSYLKPIAVEETEDQPEDEPMDEEDDDSDEPETAAQYAAEDIARSGVRIELQYDGTLRFQRGLVRKEEKATASDEKPAKDPTALTPKLVEELTCHRTAALRLELTKNARVARIALVHALVSTTLVKYGYDSRKCLTISLNVKGVDTPNPDECPAHAALAQIVQDWREKIPEDQTKLFAWVAEQSDAVLDELLTVCTALSLHAVKEAKAGDWVNTSGIATSHEVAKLVNLDMTAHWTPTAEGFLSRLSKGMMQNALTQAGKPEDATRLGILKKAPAATATAEALKGTGWLPAPLAQQKQEG